MSTFLSADYWNERYVTGQTGWDIGAVSIPLKTYIDQLTNQQIRILIPGGGNSYEAIYLLEQGFTDVTVIDIAPAVTESLKKKLANYGAAIHIITGDFFALNETYDLILEQTFFCALDPVLRKAYVTKMASLLKPGGKLVGVLFNRSFEGGPPFGGNTDEYQQLFEPSLSIQTIAPCYNSISPRAGSEVFIILKNI